MAKSKKNFSTAADAVMETIDRAAAPGPAAAAPGPEEEAADTQPAPVDINRRPGRPRRVYTELEIEAAKSAMRDKGKVKKKLIRFNMAFDPDVYEYLTIMSRARGETVTEFTNTVFRRSMEQNADIYAQARSFIDEFK